MTQIVKRLFYAADCPSLVVQASSRPREELKRQLGPAGLGVLEERDWRSQMSSDGRQSPRKERQMCYYRNEKPCKDKEFSFATDS